MKQFIVLIFLSLTIIANDIYIYKFLDSGIPSFRTNKKTGEVEVFSSLYLKTREMSKLDKVRLRDDIDEKIKKYSDEKLTKYFYDNYYKGVNYQKYLKALNEPVVIKETVTGDLRWINVNEYNKINKYK